MLGIFKRSILSVSLVSVFSLSAVAADDYDSLAPNEYDCTKDELISYIEKKSESIVQRDTAITDFESFKIATQGVGSNLDTYANVAGKAGTSQLAAEDCDYFWGDIDEVSIDMDSELFDKIWSVLNGGGIDAIYDLASQRISSITDGMLTNIKKGLCSRLNTTSVKREVYKYGNELLKQNEIINRNINSSGDVNNEINGFINSALSESLGSTGKLLNLADPKLDNTRNIAVERETKRQLDSIMNIR